MAQEWYYEDFDVQFHQYLKERFWFSARGSTRPETSPFTFGFSFWAFQSDLERYQKELTICHIQD